MRPLSERIKDFPTDQFIDWLCLACVDVREVRTEEDAQEEINKIREAVTARISALEQRAEAAEAKLAELERQEPVAMRYRFAPPQVKMPDGSPFYGEWKLVLDAEAANPSDNYERENLYSRPVPTVSMAELVPPEMTNPHQLAAEGTGWNDCRAAMLRRIEAAK